MPDYSAVPPELTSACQWVVWRIETRDGKPTKVPYAPATGHAAATDDPATWSAFPPAVAASASWDGIGYVFVEGGGVVGIDLDNCIDAAGSIKPWAKPIIDRFATYAEVSPSGVGVKIWARGKLPTDSGRRRKYRDGVIEMYEHTRYFTVTGRRLEGKPSAVNDCAAQVAGLYNLIGRSDKKPSPPPPRTEPVTADDQIIIDKLLAERTRKAAKLWSGDTAEYLSGSEADAALCSKIGYYVGNDPARIDSLFRQSMLCRGKWADREDYRSRTITFALSGVSAFYDWSRNGNGHHHAKTTIETPPAGSSSGLKQMLVDTISGKIQNIEWGWSQLTGLARALMPGTVTVLCGGGGTSKSMMLSQASLTWLRNGIHFAVFHLEEDRKFHQYRALAQLARDSRIHNPGWVRSNPKPTMAAYDEHAANLDRLGECMWDAPRSEVAVGDLTDWVRDRAKEGARVIAVDPVTAADSGNEPWHADRRFVLDTKTIMRDYGASLIVVTHPRDGGGGKNGSTLDNIAGGQAYNRFTQTVLMLESFDEPASQVVKRRLFEQTFIETVLINRVLRLRKVRNGPGGGSQLGLMFSGESLLFQELGIVVKK